MAAKASSGYSKYLLVLVLFLSVWYALDKISHRFWVFDQHKLHQIASEVIALPHNSTAAMISELSHRLAAEYPKHINLKQEWVFNNAGGAMGAMYILHASITEYLIIFGTPVGTEGHTGRHMADDYFIILQGEQWAFTPGQLEKEVYRPGHMHHLVRGDAQQYKIPDSGAWALEYARGWIPAMLPFGLADCFFSTLDLNVVWDTFRITGKRILYSLSVGKF